MSSTTRTRLIAFIASELEKRGRPIKKVGEQTGAKTDANLEANAIQIETASLFNSGLLDSLVAVRLVLFIEQEFHTTSPLEVSNLSSIDTVSEIEQRIIEAGGH